MSRKPIEALLILCVLVGAFIVIPENSEACFSWSVSCSDPANNVDKGDYTLYEISMSFSPGCKSTYWVSFSPVGVPSGWETAVLDSSGLIIEYGKEIVLSGTVTILISFKVTTSPTAVPDSYTITLNIRATDYYNQDETKSVVTITTVNAVDHAPNPVVLSENGVTQTTVNLIWTESDEPNATFDRYDLHMSLSPDFTPVLGNKIATIHDRGTTVYQVTGLSQETTYYFCVRVWDNVGPYFADSNILEVTTLGANVPPEPVFLYDPEDVTNCEANLIWTKNNDNDFHRYEIHVSTTPGFKPGEDTLFGNPITDQSDLDFLVTGLTENTTYYFKVRVYDTGKLYADSNEVSCTTLDYIPDPIILDDPYDTGVSSTNLKWTQSCISDFHHYEVHISETPGFAPGPETKVMEINESIGNHTIITGLNDQTTYYFVVRVVDLAGNYIDSNEVFDTTLDGTLPWIILTSPVHSALDVEISESIVVTFSEQMDIGTMIFDCQPNPGGWSWVWSNGDQTVTFSHNDFNSLTMYIFYITTIKDLAGNDLVNGEVPNPWSFTTKDVIPPYITITQPVNSATNVDITESIEVSFSEPMDTATVTFTCSPDPGGWSETWSNQDQTVTYTHNQFEYMTIYTCEISSAKDLAGNDLVDGSVLNPWSFTTKDAVAPFIISTDPADGAVNVPVTATLYITFSESMETSCLIYTCIPDPGGWSCSWNDDETTVMIFHNTFESLTHYTFHITGAKDKAGNDLIGGGVPNPYSFDTVDATPPTVVMTKPAKEATNVEPTTSIYITFSEEMDQQSVLDALDATFSYDTPTWNQNTIILTPPSQLDSSTEYTVIIGAGAMDSAGNHMDSPFTLVFTTKSGPSINHAPNVGVSSPNDDVEDKSTTILWTATDIDGDTLTISVYYDADNDHENGGLTLIKSGLSNSGSYIWDTTALPEGVYYIYVKANDGKTEAGAYSGLLTIDHPDDTGGDTGGDEVDIGGSEKGDSFPWILLWIIICIIIILTLIGAMIYKNQRNAAPSGIKCSNCGKQFTPFDPSSSSATCPNCGETTNT